MRTKFFVVVTLLLTVFAVSLTADAQRRRSSRGASRSPAASPSTRTKALLPRIQSKITSLNAEVDRVASRGSVNSTATDTLSDYISRLDESTSRLDQALNAQGSYTDEMTDVLTIATRIDQFLVKNQISPSTQTQWRSLKRDLTSLAATNRVSWNWRQYLPPLPPSTVAVVPTPTPYPTPMSTPYPTPFPTPYPTATPYSGALTYTASDAQMSTLLSRIDLKASIFRGQLGSVLRSGNNTDLSNEEITAYVTRFESAESRLRQGFERRQTSLLDLTDLLTAATYLDQFMGRNGLAPEVEGQWRDLKGDLNTLTTYYQQSWNWNQTLPSSPVTGTVNLRNIASRITGTYQLNRSMSEDTATAIDRATASLSGVAREDERISLERRLRSPEMLAIEMVSRTVNMASSILPKVTFEADGRARTETNARGRTVTTTATLDADGLTVNFQGERASDFYLTLVPSADGRLRVTRRIFPDNSNESIRVTAVYDKVDTIARWDLMSPSINNTGGNVAPGTTPLPPQNSLLIPVGTRIEAELQNAISGPATDRFTMSVVTPGRFRGGMINGRVLAEDLNSRQPGVARVLLVFDSITLQGQTYRFSGNVFSILTPDGRSVQVTNQNAAVTTTQQQSGAGSILGALIGAIAGVPVNQSAQVGGAVVTVQGDVFSLAAGTRFSIETTNPQ